MLDYRPKANTRTNMAVSGPDVDLLCKCNDTCADKRAHARAGRIALTSRREVLMINGVTTAMIQRLWRWTKAMISRLRRWNRHGDGVAAEL